MPKFGDMMDSYLAELIGSANHERLYLSIPDNRIWENKQEELDFGFKRLATLYALAEAKMSLNDLQSLFNTRKLRIEEKQVRTRALISNFFTSLKRSLDLITGEINILLCRGKVRDKSKWPIIASQYIEKMKKKVRKERTEFYTLINERVEEIFRALEKALKDSIYLEIRNYRDLIVHKGIPWFCRIENDLYLFRSDLVESDKQRIYNNHIIKSQEEKRSNLDIRDNDFPPGRPEVTQHLNSLFMSIREFVDKLWGLEADILTRIGWVVDKVLSKSICRRVLECSLCNGLDGTGALCISQKEIGLNYQYPPNVPIKILFVAESPPKPGNGFFYDESTGRHMFRQRLFTLINAAGLGTVNSLREFTSRGYYLADALNCRWDKTKKKSLSSKIFKNCSRYLEEQIRLFRPCFIVAMGNKAKEAVNDRNVSKTIRELGIPDKNIIRMSFILVARTETDQERIEKLKKAREPFPE
ncbi:MAG: uracil-DNA glycosylase family protein [Pseudomonadota bacterium]